MNICKICLTAFLAVFAASPLLAIPAGFNVQGRLTDGNGVNKPDADYQVKFSIYTLGDPLNPSNQTAVWQKTETIHLKNGNFQILLSGTGDSPAVLLETAVENLDSAYLEITVIGEPPMVPRQPLLRSPFSSVAVVTGKPDVLIQSDSQSANSVIAMRTGGTDRLTIQSNGNVGVGANLSVAGAISAGNLVGAMMYFATPQCPDGWVAANGDPVGRTGKYGKLYDAINTTFGIGDGINTFNLPDARGVFIRGWDYAGGSRRGKDEIGRGFGSYQDDDFKAHNHGIPTYTNSPWFGNRVSRHDTQDRTGTAYTENTGGQETRPKNIALVACIKY